MKVNQVRAGAVLSYVSIILSTVISFVYTPIMIGRLGDSEYGVYQFVLPIISYLSLLSFGLGSAYVRYYSRFKAADDRDGKVLFRTKSKTRLAMEARMVADMELYDHDRVVVMTIPLALREQMHATDADIEELSSLAALVEGTDCGVTLRELRPGTVKLSLRTGPRVNATLVCKKLGGGGHAAAAGATIEGTLEQAKRATLAAIAEVTGE